jgi:hypothetical protein
LVPSVLRLLYVNVPSKSNMQNKICKKHCLLLSWRSLKKIAWSGAGSFSQRYGSADPDPHQNVTDPQHCFLPKIFLLSSHIFGLGIRYPRSWIRKTGSTDFRGSEPSFYLSEYRYHNVPTFFIYLSSSKLYHLPAISPKQKEGLLKKEIAPFNFISLCSRSLIQKYKNEKFLVSGTVNIVLSCWFMDC